jgi:putative DNA primase/helicase
VNPRKPSLMDRAIERLRARRGQLPGDLTPYQPPDDPAKAAGRDVIHFDRLNPAPVAWLWRPWLPAGKLCLIDGDPGQGKSFITLDLAARLSRGDKWPDGQPGPGQPGNTLLVSCEDGVRDTVLPRLLALGADLAKVHGYQGRLHAGLPIRVPELPRDLPVLEVIIRETQAKLVVIDPLMAFLAASILSISDQSVRSVLTPLAALAERTGATLLFVRHLNKTGGKQAVYRGGGSIGIIASMRTAALIARHPHDREQRVLAMVKCNLGPEPKSLAFRLRPSALEPGGTEVGWEGEVDLQANDLVADVKQTLDPKQWLRQALAGGPRPVKELYAEAAGISISEPTLDRAKKALAVVSLQRGHGKNKVWYWALPDRQAESGCDVLGPMEGMLRPVTPGDAWEG